jgi:hypothetical protein
MHAVRFALALVPGRNDVSRQVCIAVRVSVRSDDCLANAFVFAQHSFDFTQFNAEATTFTC